MRSVPHYRGRPRDNRPEGRKSDQVQRPMKVEFINPFLSSLGEVLEQIVSLKCTPGKLELLNSPTESPGVTVLVGVTGDLKGQIYYNFSHQMALDFAREVLKPGGYYTAASGKWHVGEERPHWPTDRGFDNYYGLISGAANYFDITRGKAKDTKRHFAIDSTEYLPPAEGFYMTDAITENAVRHLEKADALDQPFFLYLSYTAPHWPLHARQEDIEKYRGKYMKGWDVLREERYARMVEMGIIDKSWVLSERDPRVTPWEELDQGQKERMDLLMAIYAAQVDRMDQGIGEVLGSSGE